MPTQAVPSRAHSRLPRIFVGVALFVWAAFATSAALPAPVAAAQTELSYVSNSSWVADPIAGRVHVRATITATSHTTDSGGRRYYYDRLELTVPPSTTGFTATAEDGRALAVTVRSSSNSGVSLLISLGQRLYSGASGTFDLRFDLVDPGGSTDRVMRIRANIVSFPVVAFGSPRAPGSTVSVEIPAGFTVQEDFGGLTRSPSSGPTVFTSGTLDDSSSLSAWFTAVQPVAQSDFRVRSVKIGPLNVALRYWSNDPGWADQIERVLTTGYPIMRDMIGLGDPIGTTLTVEEASTQEIGGFSGAYDMTTGQVHVSYLAEPFVILHETAHMWFNGDLASDRWVDEGFASFYAQQTLERLGLVDHSPILTERLRQASIPLNDWVSAGEPSSATDGYLYAATLETAREIAAEAGPDALRTVWVEARSGKAAYQPISGPANELMGHGGADWRRLLDLLERTTGKSFLPIWRAWVISPGQADELQDRTTTLAAYADAQTAAGSWNLPPEIRRSLDTWQFGATTAFIAQVRGILDRRARIGVLASAEQTTTPPTLRTAFERGIAGATAEVTGEEAVLGELAAARQARTNGEGATRALGLLGSDPEADLAAARKAFAEGDLEKAMTLATRARVAWEDAMVSGQVRLIGALCGFAGLILLLVVLVWAKPWRRWSQAGNGSRKPAARGIGPLTKEPPIAQTTVAEGTTTGGVGEAVAKEPSAAGGKTSMSSVSPAAEAAPDRVVVAATLEPASGPEPDLEPERQPEQEPEQDLPADLDPDAPESAYALFQRGRALVDARHMAQAAIVLERASRAEPRKGSILELLGRAYFNSGQHARAAEAFEALLEIDPSAHYGHFALGLSFFRLGRSAEAVTHLRMAVALDPSSETYRKALDKAEAAKG